MGCGKSQSATQVEQSMVRVLVKPLTKPRETIFYMQKPANSGLNIKTSRIYRRRKAKRRILNQSGSSHFIQSIENVSQETQTTEREMDSILVQKVPTCYDERKCFFKWEKFTKKQEMLKKQVSVVA